MIKNQSGFTLIELMISLSLGLIIVAAAISIFLTGQRSLALQGAMGELQESANFGLAMMTYDLRHANLNTASAQKINNKQVGSGIIFDKTKNLPSSLKDVDNNILSQQDIDNDATTGKSDQIVIQYIPEYTNYTVKEKDKGGIEKDVTRFKVNATDCEGNNLDFAEKRVIVQRYHLQKDSKQIYALYCDAGNYKEGDAVIDGITSSTTGQQIMQRIDAFKIRLGVKAPDGKLKYMTINEYKDLMPDTLTVEKDYYNVVSVEVGVIARSISTLNSESLIKDTKKYNLLGGELILNDTQKGGSKYLRGVFSQVVAFRNTLGAS